MMRGMTILWAALALTVGVGLFMLKYEVQSLEDQLASLNGEIRRNQSTIHVLKAEWSYLNDPERLRQLNDRHLGMKPFRPEQIIAIADLPLATPPGTEEPKEAPDAPAGRTMVEAPSAPKPIPAAEKKLEPRKPVEPAAKRQREALAKPAAPLPVSPSVRTVKPPTPALPVPIPAAAPTAVVRPTPQPVLQAASPDAGVLVIKSPALLEAERRQSR